MTTKKADTTAADTGAKKERGRYAKVLANGSVIEIEPSRKRTPASTKAGSVPADHKP